MIVSNPTACTCPSGEGSLRHPCQVHNANYVGDAAPFDLVAHLERQRYFSAHTFGPGTRAAGIVDHIRKELLEIEADPGDLREWVDVIILAFDGAWRSGATAQEIISAIVVKHTKNEGRTWPHWSTMPADKAIEHDRRGESAAAPEAVAYNAGGIELTACQLHEALLMAGSPELDVEFDDRSRVRIFHTDNGHSGPGLYCECVDVEEEGCILLDGSSPAIAAPVAAAPVGMTRDDAEQAISRIMGEYDFSMPSRAYAELVEELMSASTPAAPGLDPGLYSCLKERGIAPDSHDGLIEMDEVVEALNEHERQLLASTPAAQGIDLRERIAVILRSEFDMETADPEDPRYDDGHIEALRIAGKIIALGIDASPKGGSDETSIDNGRRGVSGHVEGEPAGLRELVPLLTRAIDAIEFAAKHQGSISGFSSQMDLAKTLREVVAGRKLPMQATSVEVGA